MDLKLRPIFWSDVRFESVFGHLLFISRSDGIVKKDSFWIVLELIPELNSFTCFLIYRRKASLDQRPSNMIVKTGTLARYIAMAAQWRPIYSAVKPKISGPIDLVAILSRCSSSFPVKRWSFHLKLGRCSLLFVELWKGRNISGGWLSTRYEPGKVTCRPNNVELLCHSWCCIFENQR